MLLGVVFIEGLHGNTDIGQDWDWDWDWDTDADRNTERNTNIMIHDILFIQIRVDSLRGNALFTTEIVWTRGFM